MSSEREIATEHNSTIIVPIPLWIFSNPIRINPTRWEGGAEW